MPRPPAAHKGNATLETPDQGSLSNRTSDVLDALPPLAKFVAPLLVIAALVHTVLIGLWAAPQTAMSQAVGQETVRNYAQPLFNQSWSIFAPNPRASAATLEMRADFRDESGELFTTGWYDLTAVEDALVHHNPFPPRTAKMSRRIAGELITSTADMNDEQRQWLGSDYFGEIPVSRLQQRLNDVDGGASPGMVARYMRADAAATEITTAAAEHLWEGPGELVHVQYRVTDRTLPSYDPVTRPTLEDGSEVERFFGWREPAPLDDFTREQYVRHFRAGGLR